MSSYAPESLVPFFRELHRTFELRARLLQRSSVDISEYIDKILEVFNYETYVLAKHLIEFPDDVCDRAYKGMEMIWQRQMVDRKLRFIENGFLKMLEDDCEMCLRKCFRVLTNTPMGLEKIPQIFGDFIYRQASTAIYELSGCDEKDYVDYVFKLIALREYFSDIAVECFQRHHNMYMAMINSFHKVLHNKDEQEMSRGPKLLAMYWDSRLKYDNAILQSGKDISHSLQLCAVSYDVPDYAEENLKRLFLRLTNDCCYYTTLELMLLKVLISVTNAYNKELLERGARAMEDMAYNLRLKKEYQNYQNKYKKSENIVSTSFLILQENLWTRVWPMDNESECVLPEFCEPSMAHFQQFYARYGESRSLKWMHNLSTVEMVINLSDTPCTLRATLFGVAILFCFQDKDEMSLQLIQYRTKMKPSVLLREVKLLIDIGLLNTTTVSELTISATLTLNFKFTEEKFRPGTFFPGDKIEVNDSEISTRLKRAAARRAERVAECKRLRKEKHQQLHHPPHNVGHVSEPGPVLALPTPPTHVPMKIMQENRKIKTFPFFKISTSPGTKNQFEKYLKVMTLKLRLATGCIPSRTNIEDCKEARDRMEVIFSDCFLALGQPQPDDIIPSAPSECITIEKIKSPEVSGKVSEDRIQVTRAAVKKRPEVILAIPKESQGEMPSSSRGAIPKVHRQAKSQCNAPIFLKSRKGNRMGKVVKIEYERSPSERDEADKFRERRAEGKVPAGGSDATSSLLDLLPAFLDVKPDEELIFKTNIEKKVTKATKKFTKLFSEFDSLPDGESDVEMEIAAKILQTLMPDIEDLIPNLSRPTASTTSHHVSQESIFTTTQLKDLPGSSEPRTKTDRKTRQKQKKKERTEAESDVSNVTPREPFTLPFSDAEEAEKQSSYSEINQHEVDSCTPKSLSHKKTTTLSETCIQDESTSSEPCAEYKVTKGIQSGSIVSQEKDSALNCPSSAPLWPESKQFPTISSVEVILDEALYSENAWTSPCFPVMEYILGDKGKCFPGMALDEQKEFSSTDASEEIRTTENTNTKVELNLKKFPSSVESTANEIIPATENNSEFQATGDILTPEETNETKKITATEKTTAEKLEESEEPSENLGPTCSADPETVPNAAPKAAPRSLYFMTPHLSPPSTTTMVQSARPIPAPRRFRSIGVGTEPTLNEPSSTSFETRSLTVPQEQDEVAIENRPGSDALEVSVTKKLCTFKKCGPLVELSARKDSAPAKEGTFTNISTMLKSSTPANSSASEMATTSSQKNYICTSSPTPFYPPKTVEENACTSLESFLSPEVSSLLARSVFVSGSALVKKPSASVKSTVAAAIDSAAANASAPEKADPCPYCDATPCLSVQLGRLQHPRVSQIKKAKF